MTEPDRPARDPVQETAPWPSTQSSSTKTRRYYATMSPEAWGALVDAHSTFVKQVFELGGSLAGGEALAPPTTATTIKGGGTVTDGPFVETKESLGGYYVVEARDLDHAVEIAKLCPAPSRRRRRGSPGRGPDDEPVLIAPSDEPTASAMQADAVAAALAQAHRSGGPSLPPRCASRATWTSRRSARRRRTSARCRPGPGTASRSGPALADHGGAEQGAGPVASRGHPPAQAPAARGAGDRRSARPGRPGLARRRGAERPASAGVHLLPPHPLIGLGAILILADIFNPLSLSDADDAIVSNSGLPVRCRDETVPTTEGHDREVRHHVHNHA